MSDKVDKLCEQLADALVEEGRDRNTVEVLLDRMKPRVSGPVGNLADLQRMGGMLAPQSGGLADAVVMPETATLELEPNSSVAQNEEASSESRKAKASTASEG